MAGNRWLNISIFMFKQFNMLLTVLAFLPTNGKNITVNVFSEEIVRTTSEKFLSITLGSTKAEAGWRTLKDNQKFKNLANALSPAYLRIGGTWQDYLHWDKDGKEDICYNASQLERLYNFAQTTKLDLIFGLPALRRKDDGSWDPTNAIQMFEYIIQEGFTKFGWELGNEPGNWAKENITIPAEQLVKDVELLKKILTKYGLKNPKIYGPDVASLSNGNDYFGRYLKKVPNGVLGAVTYHQYYENSYGATLKDFINVKLLDDYISYFQKAVELVHNSLDKNTPVWLGETSSTYNSGVPGLSDTYVAGFMWLDKLGITALANHTVVCRQSIYGGYYSLIDEKTMDPLPDYWSSVLYKRLVGSKVLMVENSLNPGRKARIYVHCTRVTKYYDYKNGAITLIVLNLYQNENIAIGLKGKLRILNVDQFLLQPGTQNITSKTIKLNGKLLNLDEDYHLPDLHGIQSKQPFSLPPLTYGFFVIPEAKAKACFGTNNVA